MWEQHLQETAAWLVQMADNPLTRGKAGHAAHRLEQLKADPLYRDLPQYIAEARSASVSPSAPAPASTTAPIGARKPAP